MSTLLTKPDLGPDTLTARPYQVEAIDAARRELARHRSTCVIHPTGTGKTVLFAKVSRRVVERGGRVLILAHRGELIGQAANALERVGIIPGIEKAESFARGAFDPDVVVATVQTLQRDRLASWPYDHFRLVVIDECVTGDTRVITDRGEIPIKSIPTIDCRRVLTYNGSGVVWRDITAFMPKGERPIIEVTLGSGRSIRCTTDHPIFTTRGWTAAGAIRPGDRVLCLAAAAAGPCSGGTDGADSSDSSSAIRPASGSGPRRNGRPSGRNWWRRPRTAPAAAGSGCVPSPARWKPSSPTARAAIIASATGTTSGRLSGPSSSRPTNGPRSSAHCWGIRASCTPTVAARTLACPATTAVPSGPGSNTRLHSSAGSAPWYGKRTARATAPAPYALRPAACLALGRSTAPSTAGGRSGSPENGSTGSAASGWRGGSATMARRPGLRSGCTPKASPGARSTSSPAGSPAPTAPRPCRSTTGGPSSTSALRLVGPSSAASNPTCPTACGTSFDPVIAVRAAGHAEVFDITVDGTHCFFANGMLVHNCHHATATTYQRILNYFHAAKVLGVTATPDRADEDTIADVFGSVAHEMTIWEAMTAPDPGPYLARLRFVQCDVDIDLRDIRTTGGDFNQADLEEAIRPLIDTLANSIRQEVGDRRTLAFTPDVGSAQAMATALQSLNLRADWVAGDSPDRAAKIDRYKSGDIQILANCNLLTEGFDAPETAAIALCRPTKSRPLYAQIVGRGTRLAPGKLDCLLVDFNYLTEKHELVRPADLFDSTTADPEQARIIEELLRGKPGQDLVEVVEQAREEHKRRKMLAIKAREREVKYRRVSYDPLAVAQTLGISTRGAASARHDPATPGQIEALRKFGVANPETLSRRLAHRYLDTLIPRAKAGLASMKQVSHLVANGYDLDEARGLTKQQASEALDRLWGKRRDDN